MYIKGDDNSKEVAYKFIQADFFSPSIENNIQTSETLIKLSKVAVASFFRELEEKKSNIQAIINFGLSLGHTS